MQGGAVSLGCSAMPNSRLKTVTDEFLTSIDYHDGFHVNLLFDRFFIDRCAHIWVSRLRFRGSHRCATASQGKILTF